MYDGTDQYASLTHKSTGKERDYESGLDNFGARFDSSQLGRFMSPDPHNPIIIRQGMKAGGLPEAAADNFFNGFLEDPQNWNKYTYAGWSCPCPSPKSSP
jgi:hypothetical protein